MSFDDLILPETQGENYKSQLDKLKSELEGLSDKTTDFSLKDELNGLIEQITKVNSKEQFDNYVESLKEQKNVEIRELLGRTLKSDLTDLKMNIVKNGNKPVNFSDPVVYSQVANLGRQKAISRVDSLIETAKDDSFFGKLISNISSRA